MGPNGVDRRKRQPLPKRVRYAFLAVVGVSTILLGLVGYSSARAYTNGQENQKRIEEIDSLAKKTALLAVENQKATVALCALRTDRARGVEETSRRIERTRAFIRAYPNGYDGISRATLDLSLRELLSSRRGMRQTVRALRSLTC